MLSRVSRVRVSRVSFKARVSSSNADHIPGSDHNCNMTLCC